MKVSYLSNALRGLVGGGQSAATEAVKSKAKQTVQTSSDGDQVIISRQYREYEAEVNAATSEQVDKDRSAYVANLKQQIEDGSYEQPSSETIARALLGIEEP